MAWFKCIGSIQGGGTNVSKTVLISETDFANLSQKESDTLYEVWHDGTKGSQVLKRYIGNDRITRKGDISDYEFWYEDVCCTNKDAEAVPLSISWNDFISRDWQLEFNSNTYITSSESCIFGSDSDGVLEIYYSSAHNLCIYGWGPDIGISGCENQDIKIVYDHTNNECNVYKNDTLVQTFTPNSKSSNLNLRLFSYKQNNNYVYNGIVKYIGFKWLD